jgi:hypothetical protein
MATMLEVVQDLCGRQNLPVPATVYGTTDPQIRQVMKLLEEEGNDLASRGSWQFLTFEASHTSLALEDQGAIATIASNGFRYIKNDTIWDRSTRLPVCGPLDAKSWQAMKAVVVTGPRYRFRIRGGKLLVNPAPVAGESWYFEYISKNWILGADGTTYKRRFTLDTDTLLLPDDLALQGLRWRWLREKGMDYAELFRTYEMQVKDALGRDGGKPMLFMDACGYRGPQPGIFIPEGSWNVP